MRRTKIVATIGPVSESDEMLDKLIAAGMDVARMNFSHGSHEEHAERIRRVRAAAVRAGKPLAILQDLQGPKIRTGMLVNGEPVQLKTGSRFTISIHEFPGTPDRVSTTYKALAGDVKPGDRILLSDGLIHLRVVEEREGDVITDVVSGGTLRERQGINLPGVNVSAPSLTEKDIADLEFGFTQDIDWVALSFVRKAANVEDLRARITAAGKTTPIMAKIEKPEALDDLDNIIAAVDGVMVARGDLGVEIPPEQVPVAQKLIISTCNRMGKPVITATQMLDSMIRNSQPTRAEASDVANAIIDGTDAVMLSGETAVGAYPVESIEMMARIAEVTEGSGLLGTYADDVSPAFLHKLQVNDPISVAARAVQPSMPVRAIVAFTMSGATAIRVARQRPTCEIYALTPDAGVYDRLNLVWGVTPLFSEDIHDLAELSEYVKIEFKARGYAKPGEAVVMTGGYPI
ncbi:MAG: pyruvate kinase, partial [Roseiflexaceae bacterium]|nr:pyruvate kinase [Roseiflexaceae bacterium]